MPVPSKIEIGVSPADEVEGEVITPAERPPPITYVGEPAIKPRPEPPKLKPPPPTLEPVIPQPYVPPVDAKVVARDAKGEPTVLQTPDGEKYYTPAQTIMWGAYGFATEAEYVEAWKTGFSSPYIGITKGVDKPIRVSRTAMIEAGKLTGEEQFNAYKEAGAIPYGSKFMPGPKGYKDKNWSYVHPDTIKKIKGRLIARQVASKIEPGAEFYKQYEKDWKKRHIQLKDGNWMRITDWNKIPNKYKKIGLRMGFVAMNRAMKTEVSITQRNYDAALRAMEPYKTEKGRPGAVDISYDLAGARQAEVPKQHLVLLFGEKAVKDIEKELRERAVRIPSFEDIGAEEMATALREHGIEKYGERVDFIKSYFTEKGWDAEREEYEAYQELSGAEKFNKLLEMGAVPKGSLFQYEENGKIAFLQPIGPGYAATVFKTIGEDKSIKALLRRPVEDIRRFATRLSKANRAFEKEFEEAILPSQQLWRYQGQMITDGERQDVIKAYEGLSLSERTGVRHPADDMTVVQPALVLSADKKWQELKGRPKSDPERQAYLAEWQKKVIDTAALVGTLAAPYTWGVIGKLGYALTPARIAATPIVNIIPKIATALAQITFTGAPVAYTGATISESLQESNLQRKWEIFSNADPKLQDGYARMAGYDKPFSELTDAKKASVLIHYTVPRDYTLSQWSGELAKYTDKMTENVGKGSDWLRKNTSMVASIPISFAGGAVAGLIEGVSYTVQLPMIAANLVAKVPEGDPKAFAKEVGEGMVAFFTTVLPMAIRADPALAAGRVTGLFMLAPASIIKLAKGQGVKLSPKYVPERAMGQEIPTLRVELIAGDLSKLSRAQRIKVGKELTTQLLAGEKTAKLKIGNTTWSTEVRNVPMQRVKHNIGWHFTPDINKFNPKKGTGTLYLSPQAARQAGIASLVKAEKMTHPGLIEVHLPEGYSPTIQKLLSNKKVELEIPLKDRVYDPIPGEFGKGVSGNVQMGSYPVRRFVIEGSGVEGVPLTLKQWAEVRALTLQESALDAITGWQGRKAAIKAKLAKDPRIKKVNESIKSLESETPEIVDAQGNIVSQRVPVPHPTKPGLMHNRVTALMFDKQGRVLLTKTTNDPQFYSLPGGRAGAKPGLLPERGIRTGKEIRFDEASAGQTEMETGIVWTGSSKYKGVYLGKINEYALSGSRVYEIRARNTDINIRKYGDTELSHAFWWDGKTEVTVSPAIYDILKTYPQFDMAKVTIYKGSNLLNKARDKGYAGRVESGKFISEQAIAKINKVELQRLKEARQKLIKGEPLGFAEWLTAENDFATLAELIHGRRQAVRVIHDGTVSPKEYQTLLEHPELINQRAWEILKKTLDKKKLSAEEVKLLEKELTNAFEAEKSKLQDVYDRAYEAAYRENRAYFDGRYAGRYEQVAARIVGIRRVAPKPYEDPVRSYATTLRATRLEPMYPVEERVLPVAYGEPYKPPEYKPAAYEPTLYKPTEYKPVEYKPVEYKRIEGPEPPYKPPEEPPYVPEEPPYKPPEEPPYVPEEPPVKPPEEPPFVPPRGASDKANRKKIRDADGAIAWRQGQLGEGRDVWHCLTYPYLSEADYLTVIGRKPSNTTIVRGPGSAKQTIKLRYGKPPARKVSGDFGFMDFYIEPRAGRRIEIGFSADPKQVTTGDITIGRRRAAPITDRQPLLGERSVLSLSRGRSPRITPRIPRLRR